MNGAGGPADLVITGGEVLAPDGTWQHADVTISGPHIISLSSHVSDGADEGRQKLDVRGRRVVPGFVDLQCNGAGGIDLTAEPERLWEVAAMLPRWGVTAWLPTIVTAPEQVRKRARATLAAGPPPEPAASTARPRAEPLGLHFEGPFLAPARRGAHVAEHLQPPSLAAVEDWSRDSGVALVTLAPELPDALDVVRTLVDRGVVVSAGHSEATVEEARVAVDAGVRSITHLFNAMSGTHHREPGLATAALTDHRLTVGLIADGVHVHPRAIDLAARLLGDRLVLVTDAMAALGARPGRVALGDAEARTDGAAVRLADGTLAGSVLAMDRAVANLQLFAGWRTAAAVAAASTVPARLLGVEGERGVIAPGALADLVVLDGDDIAATVVAGRVAYRRRLRRDRNRQ